MSTLGRDQLVYNTTNIVSGGLHETLAAAVAGGYDAISVWPQDLHQAKAAGLDPRDAPAFIHDHGLVVADVDCLLTWTAQARPETGEAMVELLEVDDYFEVAELLGARSINLTQGFGSDLDYDQAAEDLAKLCDRAAEHGLLMTYEFLPWSGVPTVAAALDLVVRANRSNARILFDSWHWFRGGADFEMLRDIPGEMIASTQWNDAPVEPWPNLPAEAMAGRLLPGEGDIPLVALVQTLDRIGCKAPTGVEVINREHESMDPAVVGQRTADSMRAILAKARV